MRSLSMLATWLARPSIESFWYPPGADPSIYPKQLLELAVPKPSSTSITTIVYDFGGVLISPITGHLEVIAGWHDVSMVQMLEVLMGPRNVSTLDHPWHRAERGEISVSGFQEEVVPFAQRAGITLRGDEFAYVLNGQFTVRDTIVENIERQREQGFQIGLLTNSFKEFRSLLESKVDFALFDVVVDSSEVGCRKPEPEIYKVVERMSKAKPAEILYLDDFAANIEGAVAAGWQTIHVTGEDHILGDLEAALAP